MIALLRQVADPGTGEGARWAQMRTHRIKSDMLVELGASSKFNAEWDFVTLLRDEGRRAAAEFLEANADHLGKRSDLDMLLQEC
jgi:NTE family protein